MDFDRVLDGLSAFAPVFGAGSSTVLQPPFPAGGVAVVAGGVEAFEVDFESPSEPARGQREHGDEHDDQQREAAHGAEA